MKIVVTTLTSVVDTFIAAFLMAGFTSDVLVFSDQRKGRILIVIEDEFSESLLGMASRACALELTAMNIEMTGVAVRRLL